MNSAIQKKQYTAPKIKSVGTVAKLTLKTGSQADAGLVGFI